MVALCHRGKVGVITRKTMRIDRKDGRIGPVYYGRTLDGHSWQSRSPKIIADTVNEYVKYLVDERVKHIKKHELSAF